MKHRTLIVEDHNLLRQGLRSMVAALPDFEVVGEAREGKEAIRQALALQPDLILMDLSMPGMNGIEATAQIKRRLPQIRIIALTAFKSDEYVREALRAGADGYVMKDASYDELLIALAQCDDRQDVPEPRCFGPSGRSFPVARPGTCHKPAVGHADDSRAQHLQADCRGTDESRRGRIPEPESEDCRKAPSQRDAQARPAQCGRTDAWWHSSGD